MKLPTAKLLAAWLLAQALSPIDALVTRRDNHTSSLLSKQHPFRCSLPTSKCTAFGTDCKKDGDCFSYHCYHGKCGYARSCSVNGDLCRKFSSHTCCSGKCKPVVMVDDCHRLLKGSGSPAMNGGVNLGRQCQNLGICEPFDSSQPSPNILSTPWAVPATDVAVKYNQRGQLTFKEGSIVRKDLFVARRVGQTYDQIPAGSMKPGAIRDAGVIIFTDDSKVHPEMGKVYQEGMVTYCVAPILQNGVGGGYFAVCKGMVGPNAPPPLPGAKACGTATDFKFECDDSLSDVIKSGLVMGAETEKFASASTMIETEHGWKYHDKTKGIKTLIPIFVRIMKDYVQEALTPHAGYTYVLGAQVTQCVAPIMDGTGKQTTTQFWAAGVDCCDAKTGFACGDVDKPAARSGERFQGDPVLMHEAISMAELRYNLAVLPPTTPTYWTWTEATLVPAPPR